MAKYSLLELRVRSGTIFRKKMDSEPAVLTLLDMIVDIKPKMGHKASKLAGKPHYKGRTAKVKRFIQTVK